MNMCEDMAHEGGTQVPAVWVMVEYTNPGGGYGNNIDAVTETYFNACESCARYWLSQAWVNVKRFARIAPERKRDMIPTTRFTFHAEYRKHDVFALQIVQGSHIFQTEVIRWDNAVRNLRNFIAECGDPAAVQRAMVSVYQTGYGNVGTANVRLIPIG